VTAWRLPEIEADRRLIAAVTRLRERAGEHVYGEDTTDLAATIIDLLRARGQGLRLAVAESCTGGLLGGRITAVPGSSEVFAGGIIAYDDEVKREFLGVPDAVIRAHGAVSEEVVLAMAAGAQQRFGVAAALAVTGIAGPGGGSEEKPVGMVWVAARVGNASRALKRLFPGERAEIRARSAQAALDLLRRLIGTLGL
jgi:nicotinamide-nucleotide amidase